MLNGHAMKFSFMSLLSPALIKAQVIVFCILVDTSCSDLDVVRIVNSVVTILYVLLMIMSFAASITGCAGACCSPEVC